MLNRLHKFEIVQSSLIGGADDPAANPLLQKISTQRRTRTLSLNLKFGEKQSTTQTITNGSIKMILGAGKFSRGSASVVFSSGWDMIGKRDSGQRSQTE